MTVSSRSLRGALAACSYVALLLSVCAVAFAEASAADRGDVARAETLVVGVVSDDPKKRLPKLEAMADYLAAHLGDHGIVRGDAIVAADKEEMISLLTRGDVDVLSETVFAATLFVDHGGAEPLLREWKKGVASYRSVFITRRDSGIESIADLKGKKIAFEDAGSTTGFLLPMSHIRSRGLAAVDLRGIMAAPPKDKVGYAFATEEINIAAWVSRGLADAGAFSNYDWEEVRRTPEPLKKDLRVFEETPSFVRSLILVRGGLDPAIKSRIKALLLAMHETEDGKKALEKYNKVAKYDEAEDEIARNMAFARSVLPALADELY